MSNSKYQEAKSNIVNTLVRQIGYEAYKNLYSEDFNTLQELVDKAVPEFIVSQRKNGIKKFFIIILIVENLCLIILIMTIQLKINVA